MNPLYLGELKKITAELASEIVFTEAGKDDGLLPINNLIQQMEELLKSEAVPEQITQAIAAARGWVDGIFETTAVFSAPILHRLNEWMAWMQDAIFAFEHETALTGIPDNWGSIAAVAPSTGPLALAGLVPPATDEPTLTLNSDADGDLLREFINESNEHLQNIEQGVLVLEENPTDAETLSTIFRAFHTFKGGSGFLQLIAIQTLAHELESLLDELRQRRLAVTPPLINLILEGGDTLKKFVVEIDLRLSGRKAGIIMVPTLQLLQRIRAVLQGEECSLVALLPPETMSAAPSPRLAILPPASAASDALVQHVHSPGLDAPTIAPSLSLVSAPVPKTAAPGEGGNVARMATSSSVVKVDTTKLDSLVDLIGELVIGQSLVVQNRALLAVQDEQLTRSLAQLGRITKDLQRTAMSLRMMPIRTTFLKMNRLVRDTATRIGKQVELMMEGEETEIDRTIVDEIGDPLVHMIRNAMDHGIEMPDVRRQRGKPPQGTIWLKAFYEGGNIVIEIKDDGNGLDKVRLRAKAVEKGIVRADAVMTESEIFSLIFAAGFSTAEKVTDLSGRGVGMDVVRRNIEKLRGKVEIQSTLGQGSTFRIYLPLTLAIIDGLIVGIGEHRYILPTLSVSEAFRPRAGMISSVYGRGEMISVRGRLLPVLRLHEHLAITPTSIDPLQSIAVVVENGKDARCLIVDQLLGKQEVVIKSLGETFKRSRMLAGAAILGDGRVGLILDPHALVKLPSTSIDRAA